MSRSAQRTLRFDEGSETERLPRRTPARHGHTAVAVGLALAASLVSVFAGAQSSSVPRAFSVLFSAPPACPAQRDFEAAVLARAPGARLGTDPGGLELEVEITELGATFAGVLWITLPDRSRSRRDVRDGSCGEAVASMAVIAALALDGYRAADAAGGAPPDGSSPTPANAAESSAAEDAGATTTGNEATPAGDAGSSAAAASPEAPKPVPREKPARVPPRPAARREPDRSPSRPPSKDSSTAAPPPRDGSAKPGGFAHGLWESAVAPGPALGVHAGLELRWEKPGWWSPSARVGIVATATAVEPRPEADAHFRLLSARATFCPIAGPEAASLLVRGCAEIDAGALRGAARGVEGEGTPQWMPWVAFGPGVRAELALTSWLALETTAVIRVLAEHDRFVFEPEPVVHDVPWVSAGLGLGLAARLP